MDAYTQQAELIKALAHPTRLRILDALAVQESCVCHLTTLLRARQPYISQQLMVLREAGVVLDRRDGTIVYYRLASPQVGAALAAQRELLTKLGGAVALESFPRSPLPGCPCPRCGGEGEIVPLR
jgi:ArsR family transcriptional regulator